MHGFQGLASSSSVYAWSYRSAGDLVDFQSHYVVRYCALDRSLEAADGHLLAFGAAQSGISFVLAVAVGAVLDTHISLLIMRLARQSVKNQTHRERARKGGPLQVAAAPPGTADRRAHLPPTHSPAPLLPLLLRAAVAPRNCAAAETGPSAAESLLAVVVALVVAAAAMVPAAPTSTGPPP